MRETTVRSDEMDTLKDNFKLTTFRLHPIWRKEIDLILDKDAGVRFDNFSHFIRVAVIKLIEEIKNEKKQ